MYPIIGTAAPGIEVAVPTTASYTTIFKPPPHVVLQSAPAVDAVTCNPFPMAVRGVGNHHYSVVANAPLTPALPYMELKLHSAPDVAL